MLGIVWRVSASSALFLSVSQHLFTSVSPSLHCLQFLQLPNMIKSVGVSRELPHNATHATHATHDTHDTQDTHTPCTPRTSHASQAPRAPHRPHRPPFTPRARHKRDTAPEGPLGTLLATLGHSGAFLELPWDVLGRVGRIFFGLRCDFELFGWIAWTFNVF